VHELSIAQSIADSALEHAAQHGSRRVLRVGVKVGEISGVNADALQFCFGMTVQGTDLEGASLDLERIPVRFRCQGCATEFPAADFTAVCPSCTASDTRIVAGDELALSYLELEEGP
jgi:hydrogenase nickel incorporation protein HypA/HybF